MSDLGVLVVGHGTRDMLGQAQMRSLACQTAGLLAPLVTELGFLELAEPTIAQGVARLAAAGVRRFVTVPALLFRAGHADRDIPQAVASAAQEHSLEVVGQTAPLELQKAVLELSAQRFQQALDAALGQPVPPGDIALAMIARGSSSTAAAAQMEEFARRRQELTPVGACRVGYAAVRQPSVADSLNWLRATDGRVLVAQPHLLFEGEVYHSLCEAVEERRQVDSRIWIVYQPLGAGPQEWEDQRLAEVLAGLVTERYSR